MEPKGKTPIFRVFLFSEPYMICCRPIRNVPKPRHFGVKVSRRNGSGVKTDFEMPG